MHSHGIHNDCDCEEILQKWMHFSVDSKMIGKNLRPFYLLMENSSTSNYKRIVPYCNPNKKFRPCIMLRGGFFWSKNAARNSTMTNYLHTLNA